MGKNFNRNKNKGNNNHNKHKSKFHDRNKFQKPKGETIVRKLSDLSEKEIGITQYVYDAPGFTGIIKAR